MRRAGLFVTIWVGLCASACQRPPAEETPSPEQPPAPLEMKTEMSLRSADQEMLSALAGDGGRAFASLSVQQDIHHGTTWYKGSVPARGSTAYLYLGKLGEGSSTLRLVVRHEGSQPADLANCAVVVDEVAAGNFSPTYSRADQPDDGSVVQVADLHFDEVRPIVLAMINGQSAVIRTADGTEIRLGRAELDEMRKVLAAYLHLQMPGSAAPP